jgi:xylulose-5-phosphate/fructose-6-phosphate phosphoketolase
MIRLFGPKLKPVDWMKKYLRYVDYIAVAQMYLKENFLLREELKPEHFKLRILGHWGTVPGMSLIYAGLNHLICKHKCSMIYLAGPGHGAPAVLANVYAEGSLKDFYPEYSLDEKGVGKIIKDFSWPRSPFPSHVTPTVPGSILEGGELGYSLSTAFGAALDNPNLIAVAVIGDGEAETAPIAGAWHSNKFLNPKVDGAVLPIVHINGYKISNPTIFGTMSDKELGDYFTGNGYEPIIVKGSGLERKILDATEKAYKLIRAIQIKARKQRGKLPPTKAKWPVILLRTQKGWKGPKKFGGHKIEGSFRSHGIPIGNPRNKKEDFETMKKWLESYKIHELVDEKGRPHKEILSFIPKGNYRMGKNKHAFGGDIAEKLKLPRVSKYEVKFKKRGGVEAESMTLAGEYLRDIIKSNKNNFRLFCPDEAKSNKLDAVFDVTDRVYLWPVEDAAENISTEGRVMEVLSEHNLQGWYQGYLLTGRYGVLPSYEAFWTIVSSMVDQYAKFLKQSFKVKWRKPVPGAVYIMSSLGWRQDHNGYSHQNPSFVSNVLQKHGEFCQIHYPADANSLIVALEEGLKKKDYITVIVAGKRELPVWLSMKEALKQSEKGIAIWDWATGKAESKNPDVVLASAGDYLTQEALAAVKLCKEIVPELKIRYVNVSELTALGLGDYCSHDKTALTEEETNEYFTKDRPVVFNYHGYTNDIKQILWQHNNPERFSLHGYREEGSTTTPFDLKIVNGVSCYHLAIDMIERGSKYNKIVSRKKKKIVDMLKKKIEDFEKYIVENGDDPDEVKALLKW